MLASRSVHEKGRVFQNSDPNEWGSFPGSSAPVSPALALVGFIGLCLLVDAADASVIARASHGWYLSLNRPPGTPPDWVFAAVWAVLYPMIGLAGWLAWRRAIAPRAVRLWGWQLAAGACLVPAFFGLHSPPLALVVSLVLLVLVALTVRAFLRLQRIAAWLMVPYGAWAGYLTYLAACFWWLNPA